ncbi:MAG: phage late control D family protein [Xenococcaceae cyanobacterium]
MRVNIQGRQLSEAIAVLIDEDLTAPNMFEIALATWNEQKQEWVDSDRLELGDEVEIFLGYRNSTKKLIIGEITGLEPEFARGEVPRLTIRGYDYSHRLLRGNKTRTFTQKKDSDIAREIARAYGLSYRGHNTGITLDYVLQHNQTDWEFLGDRAQRIGYEVSVKEKTLYFQPPQSTEQPTLTLSQSKDLLSFSCRLTSLTQVGQVEVSGWNPKEKKSFVERARSSDRDSGPQASDRGFGYKTTDRLLRPVANRAQARQIAKGQFDEMALCYISGEGTCIGRTDLHAGMTVNIEGVGKRFSGVYYLTTVTHSYYPHRGYRTAFTVRRNAT